MQHGGMESSCTCCRAVSKRRPSHAQCALHSWCNNMGQSAVPGLLGKCTSWGHCGRRTKFPLWPAPSVPVQGPLSPGPLSPGPLSPAQPPHQIQTEETIHFRETNPVAAFAAFAVSQLPSQPSQPSTIFGRSRPSRLPEAVVAASAAASKAVVAASALASAEAVVASAALAPAPRASPASLWQEPCRCSAPHQFAAFAVAQLHVLPQKTLLSLMMAHPPQQQVSGTVWHDQEAAQCLRPGF